MPDHNDLGSNKNTSDQSGHPSESNKWSAYFLEFLMIFLAVTLGFIAESIREHFVEKKHEKEYAISLVRDLQNDTLEIAKVVIFLHRDIARADTMIT